MTHRSQFRLLGTRRFLPFFVTQFLGAFNDNLFKQALVLAILYRLSTSVDVHLLVNLCALLFILPFFLFSALGGQLGEKYEKACLMRRIKLAEIPIMLAGALGIWSGSLPLLLAALFCMGTQSALFGPVKYAILPQQLHPEELVGGNALVEMATFLAILGGTILAGVLMSHDAYAALVSVGVVSLAVIGYLSSRAVPPTQAAFASLSVDWNPLRQSLSILRLGLSQQPAVSRGMIGNSWFWFLGALYLTQIPAFTRDVLHGDEGGVTLILAVFSVGIAFGSLCCGRLSRHRVEPGLVPPGAFGLTLFGVLLAWHAAGVPPAETERSWLALLVEPSVSWVLLDILALGTFGGLYIVPLYALIQSRTPCQERSRVIAANNILNALFMVLSAVFAILLLTVAGLSIAQLFLATALLNVLVTGWMFLTVPEFLQRLRSLGQGRGDSAPGP